MGGTDPRCIWIKMGEIGLPSSFSLSLEFHYLGNGKNMFLTCETNTYLILLPHSELIITSKLRIFFNSCFAVAAETRDLESLSSRSHEVPYVLLASRTNEPDSSVTHQNCKQKEMARVLEYSPAWSRCWGALYSIASRQSVEKL